MRYAGLLAGLLLLGPVGACSHDAVDAADPPPSQVGRQAPEPVGADWRRLHLAFDEPTGGRRVVVAPIRFADGLVLDEVTSGTAHVQPARGPTGGAAAFGSGSGSGHAALVVRRGNAELTPGAARMRIGVDVVVDERLVGSGLGANLVQRGLYDTGGQVKLQIDDGVPSCRIAGTSGNVLVRGEPVGPGTWYRLLCERDRARVTLYVARLGPTGPTSWTSWTRTGATGAISWPDGGEPLSIGAKMGPHGHLVSDSPDAFLGAVDNVLLEVQPR